MCVTLWIMDMLLFSRTGVKNPDFFFFLSIAYEFFCSLKKKTAGELSQEYNLSLAFMMWRQGQNKVTLIQWYLNRYSILLNPNSLQIRKVYTEPVSCKALQPLHGAGEELMKNPTIIMALSLWMTLLCVHVLCESWPVLAVCLHI